MIQNWTARRPSQFEIELGSVSRVFARAHCHACYVGSWEANDFY